MTGIIVPRPVALVSTIDRNGVPNLAPFSFFTGVGSNPPTVLFCPVVRSPAGDAGADAWPDCAKTHCATSKRRASSSSTSSAKAIADAANASAAEVPPEVDEFVLSGLTPRASELVRPARVAESPAQMECKLLQVIYTSRAPGAGVIVLGEIVRFHVLESLVEDFRVDPDGLDAVGRMAGNTWVAHPRPHRDLNHPAKSAALVTPVPARAPRRSATRECLHSHSP
jgi:flavin reductase (DIM6/NTAB) family NADH-FMN oxidoreductase RutF